METSGNTQPLQRLLLDEALADVLQHRHLLRRPFDLALARVGKANILHITLLEFCCRHSCSPRSFCSWTNWYFAFLAYPNGKSDTRRVERKTPQWSSSANQRRLL